MSAFRNFILTLFLSLIIFGLLAFGIVKFTTSSFRIDDKGVETGDDVREEGTNENGEPISGNDFSGLKGESYTILFAGTDYLPSVFSDYDVSKINETAEGFPIEPRKIKADMLIVVHVSKETGDCVFCSIPSSTKIQIDGLTSKLEDLYPAKGASALATKVSALIGLNVDFYAIVSSERFPALVTTMGGVTYYVSTDMNQKDEEKGLDINLKKGSQKLNGSKALDMLRYSGYLDGEVSRRKCSTSFLKTVLKNEITTSASASPATFYSKYAQFFETNMTLDDFSNRSDLIFAYSRMNIIEYTYPGNTSGIGDNAVFNANISKATEYFSQYKYQG